MSRVIKTKSGWKEAFLRAVSNGHPEKTAAGLAGVGLDKLYHQRKVDSDFAADWGIAKLDAKEQARF